MRTLLLAAACSTLVACPLEKLGEGGASGTNGEATTVSGPTATTSSASTADATTTGLVSAPELKGLTWNIETFPKSAAAADGVRQVLGDADADLVGVVEITDTVGFTALAAELGYAAVFNQQDDFQRIGILHREGVVTVSEVESLFVGETYAFPRPPIKGHVTMVERSEVDFDFIVVHLKAQVDAASQERRRVACVMLDSWIKDHVASGGDPDVMVVGDMNDDVTDLPRDNVFAPFLTAPDRYRFLTLEAAKAGELTYLPFERFLDHVLVTRDLDAEIGSGGIDVLEVDTTLAGYEANVSDHRPVSFVLRPR